MEHFPLGRRGMPALLRELRDHLMLDAPTVDGVTLGEVITRAEDVPRSEHHPHP